MIDSFFARDILELFSIRNRQGFLSLFRLLLRWSGGQIGYNRLDAIECKISPGELKPDAASEFRRRYPAGRNYVITPLSPSPYTMRRGGLEFTVCGLESLAPSAAE